MDFFRELVNPGARRRYNEAVLFRCEEGDLLQFHRGLYSHWGVYAGDGKVIHLVGDNSGSAKVREDWFWDVVENGRVDIKNRLDGFPGKDPLPGREIVERARSKLGEAGYSLGNKNCEHFATWCRYDTAISGQALMAYTASAGLTTAGLATGALPVAAVGVGLAALMKTQLVASTGSFN
ncbi:phospholipase A and acyltransferase 3-like [Branchiostoma floridae x Branchiostoma japonicum]